MLKRLFLSLLAAALVLPPAAAAHVTLNPSEWEAGGFARFAVRVPNERDNADTIELTVQFPESVISASFQPVPGWDRTVKMVQLDEPIEEEGEEPITERIDTVTWSGGSIAPGEFQEFGVSFRVPETVGEDLAFPSVQTYSNDEVVRWIGPPDSEAPAPLVAVTAPPGEAAAAGDEEQGTTTEETSSGDQQAAPAGSGEEGGEGRATLALVLGIAGLVAGLVALGATFMQQRRT